MVTRQQARALGCSTSSLKRLLAAGDLIGLLPGVYRVPGFPQTVRQLLRGACSWGGQGTAASHASAAGILRLRGYRLDEVHIVTTKQAHQLPASIHIHRVERPIPGIAVVRGIPVTPPWVTLIHLAASEDVPTLARALDDALHRKLVSLPQMRWAVDTFAGRGHAGSGLIRDLLAQRGPGYEPAESELEAVFYALIEASDLPPGTRQARVAGRTGGLRLDLLWEEAGLIVEVDGWETHGTREAFQADRARDRAMLVQGRGTMRYTWDDVMCRPQQVVEEIREGLARRRLVETAR